MIRRPILILLALGSIALGSGCGDGGAETTTTTGPVESADRARIPQGWSRHTNFNAGVEVGVPPGWVARDRGIRTAVRSPDRLVAINIAADRTDAAIATGLEEFAARVADSLPGYATLAVSQPQRFDHIYPAVEVAGTGLPESGPAQRVRIVVLEREGLVKVTALVALNAERTGKRERRTTERLLRRIRTRPVGAT